MRLVLLGPPGAGKGTLAGLLKESMHMAHISTGDILREEMNKKTALGKKVKQYIENGELVPDAMVTQLIEHKFDSSHFSGNGYMLDGFPRTKTQAEDLDKILKRVKKPLDYAVYLETSLPIIIQRLTGRRVCRDCGALYHIENKPPARQGVCDHCGGDVYQRADDNEETIRTRMDVYMKNTEPIVDYYGAQGKLKKVDANKHSQEVQEILMKLFDSE